MACIRHNNKHKAQQKQYMRPGFPFHHVHIAIIDAKVSMLKNTWADLAEKITTLVRYHEYFIPFKFHQK